MNAPTTTTANVSRAGDLSAALDNAIAALTSLDAERLEEIAGSVSTLLEGTHARVFAVDATLLREVAARHRLLGTLLASTDLNLKVLERLHGRHAMGETSWVL